MWLFGAIFTANIVTWLPMIGLAITGAVLGPGLIPALGYTIAYISFLTETLIHPLLQVCLIHDIQVAITQYFSSLVARARLCCHGRGTALE